VDQPRQGGFLISKIHQLSGRIFDRKLREYHFDQFNPAQGRIMFVLWQKDRIPIRELAKQTALEKSTLTSMLDRLEQNGFLKRVPSLDDRRQMLIELTPVSISLRSDYERVSAEMNALFYLGFSETEIDQFETYLGQIFGNLTQHERMEKK
jgi:DNA-binding MarR family transcriptional regulator